LTKGRIADQAEFSRGRQCNVTRPVWNIAAGCCNFAVAVIDFFCTTNPKAIEKVQILCMLS